MKRSFLFFVLGLIVTSASAQKPAIPRDAALEAKIEKTLSKMTLDEKIGQMLELNLDVRWIVRRCAQYSSSMADRMQKSMQW